MRNTQQAYCIRCGQIRIHNAKGECGTCGVIISPLQARSAPTGAPKQAEVPAQPPQRLDTDDWETLIVGVYVVACVTFLLGIFLPFVTILKRVSVFGLDVFKETNTVSMVSGIWGLLRDGQWLLFLVLLLFSIVFPVLKLAILYSICCDRGDDTQVEKQRKLLAITGKWSMLDVVVIGILVVTLKLGDMVEVNIRPGIYLFSLSVVLTMVLSQIAGGSHSENRTHDGRS